MKAAVAASYCMWEDLVEKIDNGKSYLVRSVSVKEYAVKSTLLPLSVRQSRIEVDGIGLLIAIVQTLDTVCWGNNKSYFMHQVS